MEDVRVWTAASQLVRLSERDKDLQAAYEATGEMPPLKCRSRLKGIVYGHLCPMVNGCIVKGMAK